MTEDQQQRSRRRARSAPPPRVYAGVEQAPTAQSRLPTNYNIAPALLQSLKANAVASRNPPFKGYRPLPRLPPWPRPLDRDPPPPLLPPLLPPLPPPPPPPRQPPLPSLRPLLADRLRSPPPGSEALPSGPERPRAPRLRLRPRPPPPLGTNVSSRPPPSLRAGRQKCVIDAAHVA